MRILLPVDLRANCGPTVDAAAAWASQFQRSGPVSVSLLFIEETGFPTPRVTDPVLQAKLIEGAERAHAERNGALRHLLERLPAAMRGDVAIRIGAPAAAIVEASRDFDLIALATHHRTGLSRLWLGSVAERVVQLSPIPVLVLPLDPAA